MTKIGLILISLNFSFPLFITGEFFKLDFFGFSVKSIIVIMCIMLIDFITGVSASVHESKKKGKEKNIIESSKGMKTIYKLVMYIVLVVGLSILEDMIILNKLPLEYIINLSRIILFMLSFIWEYQSIGENLERRFENKPKIFNLLDHLALVIEKFVKSSIGHIFKIKEIDEKPEEKDSEEV